jgi:hypothetical protein
MVARIDFGRSAFALVEGMWFGVGDCIGFAKIAFVSAAQTLVGNCLGTRMY